MYIVENSFIDKEDNDHLYRKDQLYPYTNKEISEKRINELSTTKNNINKILIKECSINDLTENQIIEYAKIMNVDIKEILMQELTKLLDDKNNKELKKLKDKARKEKITFDENITLEELKKLID